jgi:hypothetical protein
MKKVFIRFNYDYEMNEGYTEQTIEVDKQDVLELTDKIIIDVYGKLEEE